MRKFLLSAVLAASALAAGVGSSPAVAGSLDLSIAPEGHEHRIVRHWVYRPRYHHIYHYGTNGDPYAYRYVKRAWYPYYGSHYWQPADHMRARHRAEGPLPTYHSSWGRPKHPAAHRHVEKHAPKHVKQIVKTVPKADAPADEEANPYK